MKEPAGEPPGLVRDQHFVGTGLGAEPLREIDGKPGDALAFSDRDVMDDRDRPCRDADPKLQADPRQDRRVRDCPDELEPHADC